MMNDVAERERNLRDLIRSGSNDLKHYIELAHLLYWSQPEESLAILAEASALDLPEAQRGLLLNERAQSLAQLTARSEEALSLAEGALSILTRQQPTPEILVAQTNAERLVAELVWDSDRSRATQAVSHALSTIRNPPIEVDAVNRSVLSLTASRLYSLMGQLDEAIEWIHRVLAEPLTEDEKIAPLLDLGIVLRQAGRTEEARRVLEAVLESALNRPGRENPRINHELGLVERSLGRPAEAKAHFEKAVDIVNSDRLLRTDQQYLNALYMEIAGACFDLGDYRAEAQIYRDILAILPKVDPEYWTFRLSLARSEVELKRFAEAREALGDIIRSAPSEDLRKAAREVLIYIRYVVAFQAYEARNFESSIHQCEPLLGDRDMGVFLRAEVLLLLGHASAALRRFEPAHRYYSELVNAPSTPEYERNAARESLSRLLALW